MLTMTVVLPLHIVEELHARAASEALAGVGVLLPIFDEQEAKEHATQMRHVCHTVARHSQSREHLNGNIAYDEPFGLDGKREGNNKQPFVGKYHAESQQNTIDGSRRTDSHPLVQEETHLHALTTDTDIIVGRQALHAIVDILHYLLHNASTDATHNVIKNEFLRSPHSLYHRAKHPEGKHIK